MPDSQEALLVAVLAVLPGAIASRVWRNAANLRTPGTEEDRIASILVWASLNGVLLLALWSRIGPAIDRALNGTSDIWDVLLFAVGLVLQPVLLARLGAWCVLKCDRAARWLGVLGRESRGVWDWLMGNAHKRALQVRFSHNGQEFFGDVKKSDHEGNEIYVVRVHCLVEGEWLPLERTTGAFLVNKGESVLWVTELMRPSGQAFMYGPDGR